MCRHQGLQPQRTICRDVNDRDDNKKPYVINKNKCVKNEYFKAILHTLKLHCNEAIIKELCELKEASRASSTLSSRWHQIKNSHLTSRRASLIDIVRSPDSQDSSI